MTLVSEDQARDWLQQLPEYNVLAAERLGMLVAMLREENGRQNLVSAPSLDSVWLRHIADSAQLLNHVPRETTLGPWLDLGTGAGFPGLVIATLLPECTVVMVESRAKRIEWLERAREALGLDHARIAGCRVELLDDAEYAVISARAFAPLEKLIQLSRRFSTNETIWLLPKGRSAQQELDSLHGWQHKLQVLPSQTDSESGIIVGTVSIKKGRK